MQFLRRTYGVGLWVLVLSASLVSASLTVATSHAQTSTKSAGTIDGDLGPIAGDPDMPTGDTPPPSTGSGTSGTIDSGAGLTQHPAITVAEPNKRYGAWAHWKLAFRLYLRGFWLR